MQQAINSRRKQKCVFPIKQTHVLLIKLQCSVNIEFPVCIFFSFMFYGSWNAFITLENNLFLLNFSIDEIELIILGNYLILITKFPSLQKAKLL